MIRSIPRTHLSLPDYADMLGINPIHFAGAFVHGLFNHVSNCDSTWYRHTWQSPSNVSHEDVAKKLVDAEKAVSMLLGYPAAPEWFKLTRQYPRNNSDALMRNPFGRFRTISTNIGEIIDGGVRGTTLLDTVDVSYQDTDDDGYAESAVIQLADEPADWTQLKLYFAGMNADPEWEIRPFRKVDYDNITVTIDAWLLIKPEKLSQFPRDDYIRIDAADTDNLVDEVDVYLEYNDDTVPTVQFIWGKNDIVQDGYLEVVDNEAGIVRPVPALYDYNLDCTTITPTTYCVTTDPDKVILKLYAGKVSDNYANGLTLDPLDSQIAESIMYLATARLDRDLCGCSNIIAIGKDLRVDMALVSPQGNFLAVADLIQECPFGTRRGEWLAWNRLRYNTDKYISAAVI